jgi:4-hydroxy-tetrahydrodipicolinate synthase
VPGLANVFVAHHAELLGHAKAGDWPAAAAVQTRIVSLARIYDAPRGGNSFSGAAIGAIKEALVQLGIIAHPTTSPPFGEPDEAYRAHIAAVLDLAGARP